MSEYVTLQSSDDYDLDRLTLFIDRHLKDKFKLGKGVEVYNKNGSVNLEIDIALVGKDVSRAVMDEFKALIREAFPGYGKFID